MGLMKLCKCGKKIEYHIKHCEGCTSETENEKREKVKRYDRHTRYSKENKRYATFYNSKSWRVLSDIVKRQYNGVCAVCLTDKGEVIPSDTTHHIIELKEDWDLRLVETNLIPLCHDCHNNLHINYSEKEKEYLKDIIKKYKLSIEN